MKFAVSSLFAAVSVLALSANANAAESFKPYVGVDYTYTDADYDGISPNTILLPLTSVQNITNISEQKFSISILTQITKALIMICALKPNSRLMVWI